MTQVGLLFDSVINNDPHPCHCSKYEANVWNNALFWTDTNTCKVSYQVLGTKSRHPVIKIFVTSTAHSIILVKPESIGWLSSFIVTGNGNDWVVTIEADCCLALIFVGPVYIKISLCWVGKSNIYWYMDSRCFSPARIWKP